MARDPQKQIAKLSDKISKLEEKIAEKEIKIQKWESKGWDRWVAAGMKKIQKWQLKIDKHETEIRMLGGGAPQSLMSEDEAFMQQYMQTQTVPKKPPTLLYAGIFSIVIIGSALLMKDE